MVDLEKHLLFTKEHDQQMITPINCFVLSNPFKSIALFEWDYQRCWDYQEMLGLSEILGLSKILGLSEMLGLSKMLGPSEMLGLSEMVIIFINSPLFVDPP